MHWNFKSRIPVGYIQKSLCTQQCRDLGRVCHLIFQSRKQLEKSLRDTRKTEIAFLKAKNNLHSKKTLFENHKRNWLRELRHVEHSFVVGWVGDRIHKQVRQRDGTWSEQVLCVKTKCQLLVYLRPWGIGGRMSLVLKPGWLMTETACLLCWTDPLSHGSDGSHSSVKD